MITLRQLYIFDHVVRAGSFRRCAEQLGISQVSVSEHVRALEDRLEVKLFERQAGGAPVLTEKGQAAHDRSVEILAAIEDLASEMNGGVLKGHRPLNVSMHSFLARDIPPVLNDFASAYPGVDLKLQSELRWPEDLLDMVARRDLDLAYFFALDAFPGTRLVRHEPLGVFVGDDHPLAKAGCIDLDELAQIPSIQLTRKDPLRSLVDRAFAAVGIPELTVGIETDDFGMILGSVQRGMGFVCLFEATTREPSRLLGLNRVALDRQLPALQVRCAVRSSSTKDQAITAFCEAVERQWERLAD